MQSARFASSSTWSQTQRPRPGHRLRCLRTAPRPEWRRTPPHATVGAQTALVGVAILVGIAQHYPNIPRRYRPAVNTGPPHRRWAVRHRNPRCVKRRPWRPRLHAGYRRRLHIAHRHCTGLADFGDTVLRRCMWVHKGLHSQRLTVVVSNGFETAKARCPIAIVIARTCLVRKAGGFIKSWKLTCLTSVSIWSASE